MKIKGEATINGKFYKEGDIISGWSVYPFFIVHMLIFGASGFFIAYAFDATPVLFLYMHGGIAILVYSFFYLIFFGKEQVKWMFINAGLGIFGIYAEIDWLLGHFGKHVSDFPFYVHVIPFLYYILYTFLLRQVVLDIFNADESKEKTNKINQYYIIISLIIYGLIFFIM
jgi:hypothetical protein